MFIHFKRFISYGIVGVINTLLDYAVFWLCYIPLGVPVEYSQIAGFLSGSVCGYVLNSHVTFREGRGRTKAQFVQYIGLDVILSVASSWVMRQAENADVNVFIIKVAVTAVVTVIHYLVYKHFVFRIKKEDGKDE